MFLFSLARSRPAFLPAVRGARYNSSVRATHPGNCPSCGAPLPTRLPACSKCRFIQRIPEDYDFYDLLYDEEPANLFRVDKGRLRRGFLELQRHIHPDVWSPHGEDKVTIARDVSGVVNKAYNTLLSPLSRAQYILRKHGLDVTETDQLEDPELLMEILEFREALEEAQTQADVDAIRNANAELIKATLDDIEQLIGSQNWSSAHTAAVRLKYLEGIELAAKSWPSAPFDH